MFDCVERSEMKITICYFWLQIWNLNFFSFVRFFIIKLAANLFFFIKGFLKQRLPQEIFASFCNEFNPFVPNAPFLNPEKTSENLTVFWCFQGVGKWCIVNKWVNFVPLMIYDTKAIIWRILFITNDFKQKGFNWQEIWRTSIHSFRVCLNDHLVTILFFFDVFLWKQYKYIAFNIFSCRILITSCKMLIVTRISNETTNKLTTYAILCWNDFVFNWQQLTSLIQAQKKLKACRNSKWNFSGSYFIVDDSHVKLVWLHVVNFTKHGILRFWNNVRLLNCYWKKLKPQTWFNSSIAQIKQACKFAKFNLL